MIVLRNSAISNVINRTKLDSFANIDVNINVGEDLTRLENILQIELPIIAQRQPMILDGPFYRGIVYLTESAMTIRIVARCSEKNRGAVERNLKREMRLMLTRYNIAPYTLQFPHVDDQVTKEDAKAKAELEKADELLESQDESMSKLKGDNKE